MTLARFYAVVAYDIKGGIGKDGKLPWHFPEDLHFFKNITENHTVIMGRKTFDSLPNKVKPLPNRRNIVISSTIKEPPQGVEVVDTLKSALQLAQSKDSRTYVIGGAHVLHDALGPSFNNYCDGVYATELYDEYQCDTFMELTWRDLCSSIILYSADKYIRKFYQYKEGTRYPEYEYLNLLESIITKGVERSDRTGVGTFSIFGARMEFDISQSLPVLTTKKVLWEKVIGELLWMVSGSTNVEDLEKKGINFWTANATREFLDKRGLTHYEQGDLGPVYGFQWRHWGAEYQGCKADYTNKGFDQLAEVVRLLKEDPDSRRIVLSAWNASAISEMSLPPCHLLTQFYVRDGFLDCQMYQRSGDMFLGVPFNIMSYSVLTYMLAHLAGLRPGKFVHVLGDAHVYSNHVDAVKQQLSRSPSPFPTLIINRSVTSIEDFTLEDFTLKDYSPLPFIRAPMAV